MSLPQVCVLMSTYNGENYIVEQINSILKQINVTVELIIRDDGSSDNTSSIIRKFENDYSNILFIQGENVGVGRSFMELLKYAPESDYYSFADQDDVWLEDKLCRAVNMIKELENEGVDNCRHQILPVLYSSNQILVDENLNKYGIRFESEPKHDLLKEISSNKLSGCTMVMNNELRQVIISDDYRPDEDLIVTRLHDTWCMIIACIFGKIIYDNDSRILYRQHQGNVVGAKKMNFLQKTQSKFRRLSSQKYKGARSKMAAYIFMRFSNFLTEDLSNNLSCISNCRSLKGAVRLIRNKSVVDALGEVKIMLFLKALLGWI